MDRNILRFPRTDDLDIQYMLQIRAKYPPPISRLSRKNKSPSTSNWVFWTLLEYDKKKLRRLCKKHSLKSRGPRRKLLKRMYLHWRATKLQLNTQCSFYGYGYGYENTRIPDCSCGFLPQNKVVDSPKKIKRFPRKLRDDTSERGSSENLLRRRRGTERA